MNAPSSSFSLPAWPGLPRLALLAASLIGTALAVLLTHWLAGMTLGVIVFSIATALTYGLAVRLGAALALTGGLGAILGHLLLGQSLAGSLLPGLATGLGPLLVVAVLKVEALIDQPARLFQSSIGELKADADALRRAPGP